MIEPIDADRWQLVPEPGVWSIGKDAEHVAEATVYHQWIIRLALPTRPPRAKPQVLADTIDRVLIGHFDTHRAAIEEKLRHRVR